MNTEHKANSSQALDILINRVGDYIRVHEGVHDDSWSPAAKHLMAGMNEAIEIDKTANAELVSLANAYRDRRNGACGVFCTEKDYHAGQDSISEDVVEDLDKIVTSRQR